MELSDAMERIETIHAHVARGEYYRGYHPQAFACSGLIGLLAAVVQPLLITNETPSTYVVFWYVVAMVAALVAGAPTLTAYFCWDDATERRRTRIIWRQFAPCLLAGVVLTLAMNRSDFRDPCVPLLPGVWALLYGLGTVASLPYLPRLASAVATWYMIAGAVLVAIPSGPVPSGWCVGLPFGIGQLLAAGVLVLDRTKDRSHGNGY